MNKKYVLIMGASVAALTLALVVVSAYTPSFDPVGAGDGAYRLTLQESNALYSGSTRSGAGTGSLNTTLGNSVAFAYDQLLPLSGGFADIGPSGYIKNTGKITGISSLNITLASDSAPLGLTYGWNGSNYRVSDLTIAASKTYTLIDLRPDYLMLSNPSTTADVKIASLEIAYACPGTSQADPFVIDGVTYQNHTDTYVEAVSYQAGSSSVVVPSLIGGVGVTSLPASLFANDTALLSAYIPKSVTMVGANAFSGCTSATIFLEDLDVPSTFDSTWNSSARPLRLDIPEASVAPTGALANNGSAFESFAGSGFAVFGLDKGSATTFEIADSVLVGKALHFVSNGSYAGSYLNAPSFTYEANAKYRFEFDYWEASFVDTMYLQLTNGNSALSVFNQFGSTSTLNSIQHYEGYLQLGDSSDYVLQMFPGGGSGTTEFYLDNLRITKIEKSTYVSGAMGVGATLKETFDDSANAFVFDTAPTPNSVIKRSGSSIDGRSLFLVSPGSYNGFYMKQPGVIGVGTYTLTLDYKVVSLAGDFYFIAYDVSTRAVDMSMGVNADGATHSWTKDFTITDGSNTVFQFFPNASATVAFDNIVLTRTA